MFCCVSTQVPHNTLQMPFSSFKPYKQPGVVIGFHESPLLLCRNGACYTNTWGKPFGLLPYLS